MENTMHTYTDNLNTLKADMPEVSLPMRKRIARSVEQEAIARKAKRDDMLASIDENHPHAEELAKLVNEEYKVAMLEISSGNGNARIDYDTVKGEYTAKPTALLTESREHSKAGLAEEFIDNDMEHEGSLDEIVNKNERVYFDRDTGEYVTTNYSAYSLWDTIALNGALIVRKSEQWRKGFRKNEWQAYTKRRATRLHREALGLNQITEKARVTDEAMERKQAKRLARLQARRGGNTAKVGYNAFQK
jgi:hypothetical protein